MLLPSSAAKCTPCLRRRVLKLSPRLCSHLSLQPQQATWFPPGCGFQGARRIGAEQRSPSPAGPSGLERDLLRNPPSRDWPGTHHRSGAAPAMRGNPPGCTTPASAFAAADPSPARLTLFFHAPGAAEEAARGRRARGLPRCAARLAPRALRGPGGGGGRRASSGAGGRKRAREENGAARRA